MNIIHVKYALEIAKRGSINKASEFLGMAQPNISRAIKDLEADLGITIFDRSARGMQLTSEGKSFLEESKKILDELDTLESFWRSGGKSMRKYRILAPEGDYIARAFGQFIRESAEADPSLSFGDTEQTINAVSQKECELGIIRHIDGRGEFVGFDRNRLEFHEIHFGFEAIFTASEGNEGLGTEVVVNGTDSRFGRKIYVTDRLSAFEVLRSNPDCFMRSFDCMADTARCMGLRVTEPSNARKYTDYAVRLKDAKKTDEDMKFISLLK